ncbi:MAG: type II secretion system ATPase GspE [Bdellovibrionales bacterium]|nr:type II secretion system ATPase GspE [Bdellovibrionales bacterium]
MKTPTQYDSFIYKLSTLSQEQYHSILDSKNPKGKTLRESLSEKSPSAPDEVMSLLCKHLNTPFEKNIQVHNIPEHLIHGIPIQYAKNNMILPYKEDNENVFILTSNPLNFKVFSDLRVKFKKNVHPIVSTTANIQSAINTIYEKYTGGLEGLESIEEEEYDLDDPVIDLLDAEDEAPVIKLVNTLFLRAIKERASDIHIEPYERELMIRFRVDGVLYSVFKPPKRLQGAITSRIKVMADLNIAEKRLPQDGRIPLKLAGKDIDVRLSTVPTSFGERLVLRLQDRSQVILNLNQLGFSKNNLKHLDDMLAKTHGILLVTGPTGSGKSTTLYACLSQMDTETRNIITIEDPVEQRMPNVGQIQVNPKIGLTFAGGLRSILRQDPNVIMVGEIRDLETMKIAINASLTGHLVLSTLHTNDSAGVFPRLIDMGCEPFLIATSLLGVISQRLVRVLCMECKEPYQPTIAERKSLDNFKIPKGRHIYKAKGCDKCENKGYIGRTAIQELLIVTDPIRKHIIQSSDGQTIKKEALQQKMVPFRDHGIQKIIEGVTTVEEVLTNTQIDL